MGLNDLSHKRFQSKFQRSCLPFHLTHGRLSDTICGVSPTGLSRKPNSTNGDANKIAVLSATIDGSPSLCNIALRYRSRRNGDTNHDVAYSLTPFSRRHVAAFVPGQG